MRSTVPTGAHRVKRCALALLAFVVLSACGRNRSDEGTVTVEAFLNPRTADNLGYTFGPLNDGYHSQINPLLADDDDPDRIVRVIVHELLNVLILRDGERPPYEYGWLSFDSDTLPPGTPIPPAEAAWIQPHDPVKVRINGAWLLEPTRAALDRIDLAAPGVFGEE